MLDFDKDVLDAFGLEYKNIIPRKDGYIVGSPSGMRILRKTSLSPDRIAFIHSVKEHLSGNGFSNTDRFQYTLDGFPCYTAQNGTYVVTEAVDGRECNFDSKSDIIGASRLLANMHKASKGLLPSDNAASKDDLGKLPVYFRKRLDELKKLKKIAKKGKSKFDYLFLEYVDYFYNEGEDVLEQLLDSKYAELVDIARKQGIICHHDYTHHNIISCSDGFYVVNFDYCCFELKIYDIANFLRRKMRKCSWDISEARLIIEEYRKIEDIGADELDVMKLLLRFPQKFWRVANKYYNSNRSWSEKSYVSKMQEVLDEVEQHKKFLEQYGLLL